MNCKGCIFTVLSYFILESCSNVNSDICLYKDPNYKIDERVEDLLSRMSLEEKIYQLNQYTLGQNNNINNIGKTISDIPSQIGSLIYFSPDPYLRNEMQRKAVEETRLGIPILFGYDVIHGFRTVYPIPLAQAASWNPELVKQSCSMAAQESYQSGVNWTFSPMVDVARDGRWGRIAEGYGEDPYVNSVFSAASVNGYQGDDVSAENKVAACLKHYVGYGASEAGRDYVYTEISDQTMWDTYLPSFEAGVKSGALTLMSAFNNISGIPATANKYLLTDVLKDKWQHKGFVVSDWAAIKQLINQGMAYDEKDAAMKAFNAGVEMDMVDGCYSKFLKELVDEGKVKIETIDDAVRRVLYVKFSLGLFEKPYTEEISEDKRFLLESSKEIAKMMAIESMVLLKNDESVLPLKNKRKIALIGPMAKDKINLLGSWSAHGKEADVISVYEGMLDEFGDKSEILYSKGCDYERIDEMELKKAKETAMNSEVVILCLGEKKEWSGENASRSSISLPVAQKKLLYEIYRLNKPVILLISSGRPIDLSDIHEYTDAILEIWQPGVMGGEAVAELVSGKESPSGKLPVTFPYTTGQIPIYYNQRKTARDYRQGEYQDIQSKPMYNFGHGLSYTEFEYGKIKLSTSKIRKQEKITAEVVVKNIGEYDGKETVLWYIEDPFCSITRPRKELKFFEKKNIRSGSEQIFKFEIDPIKDLGCVDSEGNRFVESGIYNLIVGNDKVEIEIID